MYLNFIKKRQGESELNVQSLQKHFPFILFRHKHTLKRHSYTHYPTRESQQGTPTVFNETYFWIDKPKIVLLVISWKMLSIYHSIDLVFNWEAIWTETVPTSQPRFFLKSPLGFIPSDFIQFSWAFPPNFCMYSSIICGNLHSSTDCNLRCLVSKTLEGNQNQLWMYLLLWLWHSERLICYFQSS